MLAAHLASRKHAVLVGRALPCWEVRSVVYVLTISSFKPRQEARELHGMTLGAPANMLGATPFRLAGLPENHSQLFPTTSSPQGELAEGATRQLGPVRLFCAAPQVHSLPPTMNATIKFPLDDLAAHVAASCAIQPAGDATKTRRFEARTGTTCLIKCMACS